MGTIKMKRNLRVVFFLTIIIFVLVGCVTIPIKDKGVIKIDRSGISYVKNNEAGKSEKPANENHDEDEEDEEDVTESKMRGGLDFNHEVPETVMDIDSNQEKDENQSSSTNSTKDKEIKSDKKKEKQGEKEEVAPPTDVRLKYRGEPEVDDCNFDYSEFTDYLPIDIYIPYCAIFLGTAEFKNFVSASFLVDFVTYNDIVYNYRLFLGAGREEYFDTDELRKYAPERYASSPVFDSSVMIRGKLHAGGELVVYPQQKHGFVDLYIEYRW